MGITSKDFKESIQKSTPPNKKPSLENLSALDKKRIEKKREKEVAKGPTLKRSESLYHNVLNIDVGGDFLLDIHPSNPNFIYAATETGLKEMRFDDQGNLESSECLSREAVVLDVQIDYKSRLIYTVPEENAIYIIDNDNIIHIASLEIRILYLA